MINAAVVLLGQMGSCCGCLCECFPLWLLVAMSYDREDVEYGGTAVVSYTSFPPYHCNYVPSA